MARDATLDGFDNLVGLYLLPIGARERVEDRPEIAGYDPGTRVLFYWDSIKLEEANEYDFLAVEITDINVLYQADLEIMDQIPLPRVNVPEAGFIDATISEVLRWVRMVHPIPYATDQMLAGRKINQR